MPRERLEWVDAARGFALCLVVLYHVTGDAQLFGLVPVQGVVATRSRARRLPHANARDDQRAARGQRALVALAGTRPSTDRAARARVRRVEHGGGAARSRAHLPARIARIFAVRVASARTARVRDLVPVCARRLPRLGQGAPPGTERRIAPARGDSQHRRRCQLALGLGAVGLVVLGAGCGNTGSSSSRRSAGLVSTGNWLRRRPRGALSLAIVVFAVVGAIFVATGT